MNMWLYVQHLCRQAPVQCSAEGFAITSTPTCRSTLKFDRHMYLMRHLNDFYQMYATPLHAYIQTYIQCSPQALLGE